MSKVLITLLHLEKIGKICTFQVPILLVTVYVAPSNK